MIKPQGMSRDSGWLHHELLISLNHKVRFTVPFFSPSGSPMAKTDRCQFDFDWGE